MQTPHYINPEVGKLSKSMVDKIPLVLYIPTPPEGYEDSPLSSPLPVYNASSPTSTDQKSATQATPPRRRFVFLRRKLRKGTRSSNAKDGKGSDNGAEKGVDGEGNGGHWEDNWERGEYPFVRLEENRAACAICLLDFEEPKKVPKSDGKESDRNRQASLDASVPSSSPPSADINDLDSTSPPAVSPQDPSPHSGIEEVEVTATPVSPSYGSRTGESDEPILEDIGEGAQPLRLLGCGHAFHVGTFYSSIVHSIYAYWQST